MSANNLPKISVEDLWQRLLNDQVSIVDVRAEIEFKAGSIPNSTNRPILNDQERAQVGTIYKQQGSEDAIRLGYKLISGEVKEKRLQAWISEIEKDPQDTIVSCFRGGQRSQITQQWLHQAGFPIPRLDGGYKRMRQLLIEQIELFCQQRPLWVLSGKTGSQKSSFLRQVKSRPTVDLEALACHRGSAFGAMDMAQPTQIDFENNLAVSLGKALQKSHHPVIVEDESRLIGRCVQPDVFFAHLRSSPLLYMDVPLEVRIENILQEYVIDRIGQANLFENFQISLTKIRNKLGGLRYTEVITDIQKAQRAYQDFGDSLASRVWIEKLLSWYYDHLYESSFEKRQPKILFRGSGQQILDFLSNTDRSPSIR